MAQQARPKVIGHMLDSRAQLIACSSVVVTTLSSNRPSSQPMNPLYPCSGTVARTHQLAHFRRRRLRGPLGRGLLGCHATDPLQVAALPQVRIAHQQHAEEDQNVDEGDPAETASAVLQIAKTLCRVSRNDVLGI